MQCVTYVLYRALVVSLSLFDVSHEWLVRPLPLKTICGTGSSEYEASYARQLPHAPGNMALGMGKIIIPALDLKGCHGSSWYYHSESLSMWDTGQQI